MFLKYQELYKHEVSSEVVLQVLKLIILNGMVCLSIFSGGVVTCLLGKCNSWLSIKWLYVFWTYIPKHRFFLWSCLLVIKKINVRYSKSLWRISNETVVKWWLPCVFTCWLVLRFRMLELGRYNRFWWSQSLFKIMLRTKKMI